MSSEVAVKMFWNYCSIPDASATASLLYSRRLCYCVTALFQTPLLLRHCSVPDASATASLLCSRRPRLLRHCYMPDALGYCVTALFQTPSATASLLYSRRPRLLRHCTIPDALGYCWRSTGLLIENGTSHSAVMRLSYQRKTLVYNSKCIF